MVRKLALLILFVLESSWGASYLSATPGPEDLDAKRSEEHTSELQSPCNLVCRLLLEKKKQRFHSAGPARTPRARPAPRRTRSPEGASARHRRTNSPPRCRLCSLRHAPTSLTRKATLL